MDETSRAFKRLIFWVRMVAATILYGWAIRVVPAEGLAYLLGEVDKPPAWTRERVRRR
jgi:hypothetical protein